MLFQPVIEVSKVRNVWNVVFNICPGYESVGSSSFRSFSSPTQNYIVMHIYVATGSIYIGTYIG